MGYELFIIDNYHLKIIVSFDDAKLSTEVILPQDKFYLKKLALD